MDLLEDPFDNINCVNFFSDIEESPSELSRYIKESPSELPWYKKYIKPYPEIAIGGNSIRRTRQADRQAKRNE